MTEKDYNPNLKEKKAMAKQNSKQKSKSQTPVKKAEEQVEKKKTETTKEESKKETKKEATEKKEAKKPETKPKVKRDYAIVQGISVPISSKYSFDICKFIKGKKIDKAIDDLEEVLKKKKAIPMKGEYAHKPGKKMNSGKYPSAATKEFIVLLKSLQANAIANEIDNPIISEAFANFASRPLGRFGRWQRKRTHIKIIARDKKNLDKLKKTKTKKEKKK